MSNLATGLTAKTTAYKADPALISVRAGWNPRIDFGDVKEMADDLKQNGVLMPLRVRRNAEGNLELVDGERRLRGALQAKLSEVPIILEERGIDDATALIHTMVANHSKPLSPLEEATAIKRLMEEHQLKPAAIAKNLGRSESYVIDRILLLSGSDALRKAIADGALPVSLAQEILYEAKGDAKKEKELLTTALKGKAGKRAARKTIEKGRSERREAKEKAKGGAKRRTLEPLSKADLEDKLTTFVNDFKAMMTAFGEKTDAELRARIQSEDERQLYYNRGVVQGLLLALNRETDDPTSL